ncbi:MAG: ABC transporter permease [Ferruginibacter sp.]
MHGDALSSLQQSNAIIITEQTAKKYFGTDNAIGKVLLLNTDKKPFVVTAVLKNIPSQSSFQFDILTPISAYAEVKKRSWNWYWLQVNTYVKLKDNIAVDNASIAKLEAKFPAMVKTHVFESQGQSF